MKKLLKNKKVVAFGAISLAVIILLVIGISACNRANLFQLSLDNISESHFFMKFDESESIRVEFSSGMREENYIRDGISGNTVAFGVINVVPRNRDIFHGIMELTGTLTIGNEQVPVTLDRNQHGGNFGHDIERLVDAGSDISFTLNLNNQTIVFNLKNAMPPESISWERALEIAVDNLQGKIKSAGNFEIYVRIISDLVADTGSYWFILFFPQNSPSFFVVLDHTGNLIS